jgi:hypothetical protein
VSGVSRPAAIAYWTVACTAAGLGFQDRGTQEGAVLPVVILQYKSSGHILASRMKSELEQGYFWCIPYKTVQILQYYCRKSTRKSCWLIKQYVRSPKFCTTGNTENTKPMRRPRVLPAGTLDGGRSLGIENRKIQDIPPKSSAKMRRLNAPRGVLTVLGFLEGAIYTGQKWE